MYSIRAKILTIVLVFLTSSGAAFILYSISTTINYKNLRLEAIEKTVAFETEKVNKLIAEIERGAIFYALGAMLCHQAQERSSGGKELGEKLAVEYLNSFPAIVGGGFWFEPYVFGHEQRRAGFYAFFDREKGIVRLDDTFSMDEYDYHNKIWYREIADSLTEPYQVTWTRPYIDDSGSFSLMTTAGSGFFDENGKLMAISTVDWEIEEVIRELVAIKPTENSFVLLCVPDKDYVISSTRTNAVTGAPLQDIPWNIKANIFEFEGITYLRFSRYMDNGWYLSIQIPQEEILADVEIRSRRFIILIIFSAAIILFLAFLLISRLINAPIKQLTTDVSHLAFGNLDTQIIVKSKDELGQLARAFNKMTSDLKKSIEENVHDRAEKERIAAELGIAANIQTSMLPNVFPPFPDRKEFDLFALMNPAREVGGDFYDFYLLDRDNLAVVIADVSGKGIPAALFMVITKTLIKNCSFCRTPKSVFESINNRLYNTNDEGIFVTGIVGFYNIPTGKFVFVNAGHNPPVVKKRGKNYEFIKTEPCIILGFIQNAQYREEEIYLESGDTLYLYTDGVTEAMNSENEMFGEQRLLSVLNRNINSSPQELLDAVKQDVNNYIGDAEQTDDITMLALKVLDVSKKPKETKEASIKQLQVEANTENLVNVLGFINADLEKLNYPIDLRNHINIAVEEIFINIANYAYEAAGGSVDITISTDEKTIIRFEDTGKHYNPLDQADPDLKKDPADRNIGGLGIYMVKKIMDKVEYFRTEGKNILVITKEHP
jgi:sigma-B regulation protein RsbU (phosphoserine phosphatase)